MSVCILLSGHVSSPSFKLFKGLFIPPTNIINISRVADALNN